MDARRFDTVTKAVGTVAPRRAILKAAAAVAAGGVLTLLGRHGDALAGTCPEGKRRCGKQCYDPGQEECCRRCKYGPVPLQIGLCDLREGC
jgi:hypothetical protein